MTSAKLIASSIPGIELAKSAKKLFELSSKPSSSPSSGVGSISCMVVESVDEDKHFSVYAPHLSSPKTFDIPFSPTTDHE